MTSEDMLVDLQAGMERRAIANAPGTTRASLRAELDTFLARPPGELSTDDMRRISLLAGMPDELRPSILDAPMPFPSHSLVNHAGDRFAQYGSRLERANVEAVRVAAEVEAMAAAGTLPAREASIAEIATILDLPNEAISTDQLRRMSLLARLPEHVRPPLPPRSTRFAFEDIGLAEWPTLDREIDVGRTLDDARTFFHVLRSPEEAARSLRASFDAGDVFDLRRLAALQAYPQLLADAGITSGMMADHLARQLVRAGDADVRGAGLSWALRETRDRLTTTKLDAEFEPLRAQALELADRNLERMSGARTDTFGRHPDYAEVGRLASIAQLLGASESHASAAARPAETLAW
jgi:hypothetical protein